MRIGRSMRLVYELEITGLEYNPVPYKRTTQRAKFASEDYKKYCAWKKFLAEEFRKQNGIIPALRGRYRVEIVATYKDKTHGDTDNVAKGVNDALFASDKYVSGSYEFQYGKSGGIIVKIYEIDGEFKES